MQTDLNMGGGSAWASHRKLNSVPPTTSKESDFADLGNLGETRPAGSETVHYIVKIFDFLKLNFT